MGLNKTKIFLIPALVFNIIIFAIVCLAHVPVLMCVPVYYGTSKMLPNLLSTPKVIETFSQHIFDCSGNFGCASVLY